MKFNRDLLELGALEIDAAQSWLADKLAEVGKAVEFINEKGVSKTFNINREERLIQGQGIKGFFKDCGGDYIFLEIMPGGKVRVISRAFSPESGPQDISGVSGPELDSPERAAEVMDSMINIRQDDEKWFNLYSLSAEYISGAGYDRLICLPHLRDVDTFDYQVKTVMAVLNRFRGRVLLCDEVGLGKTIEAGMAMMEYIMRGLVRKVLILVPPSLVDQWYYEMKRKFNQDFIRYDDQEFKNMGDRAWEHYGKVIASISTAKRKSAAEIISKIRYDLVIIDEAHHLKNRKTMAWQFVNSLTKKHIFLLTATPVQNNLEELYNLITLLKPGQLKTYSFFKSNFVKDSSGLEAKNTQRLRELLSGVMIRNKRSHVDVPFTGRKASTIGVELLLQEQRLYDDISCFIKRKYAESGENHLLSRFVLKSLQEEMGSSFSALSGTLDRIASSDRLSGAEKDMLADFCARASLAARDEMSGGSPKLLKLLALIKEFGDKMLVFTKYKATQKFIADFLRQQGLKVAEFHGGLKRSEKEAQIRYFREGAMVLVSTESGGEGRNLQFCNGMVNFDLPWNPMAIEQRIGRIHRVGQKRTVHVYNLAAKNTVEYYILDLLDRKINMFELVVGEVDMILGDIEEAGDFSDIVMEAWVRSQEPADMEREMEQVGRLLQENKQQYMKVRDLDERLFGDSFESRRLGSG